MIFTRFVFVFVISLYSAFLFSFPWQQQVDYKIDVDVDERLHRIKGVEQIFYTNNSSDTLSEIYVHLYWNAFQPNSSMDVRSRNIIDPDKRVGDRISNLKPDEYGFQHIQSIFVNKQTVQFEINESILKIILPKAIMPHTITSIAISFEAQISKQIRRSGRNNAEGVMYSVAQWYPKICAYDERGWHPNQYVGREFYGEWGNFDVQISLDKKFVVAATGREEKVITPSLSKGFYSLNKNKKIWRFKAQKVHDFLWAADTNFIHDVALIPNKKIELHFYYKPGDSANQLAWKKLQTKMQAVYPYIEEALCPYPYDKYSFIQGGDGGMEYPMATLIKKPDVITAIHEWTHAWFQGLLGNNESDYAWLDEGFTNYMEHHFSIAIGEKQKSTLTDEMNFYFKKVNAKENHEAMSFPSDYFQTNSNYSLASYVKGALLLQQLDYLVGEKTLQHILQAYCKKWRFKHPQPNDFFKVAEDVSHLQLKWFQSYWTASSKTIDYGIKNVVQKDSVYSIEIERMGLIPMPIELTIVFEDGREQEVYIPVNLLLGNKPNLPSSVMLSPTWKWVQPTYQLPFVSSTKIKTITLDASKKMADVNTDNNVWRVGN